MPGFLCTLLECQWFVFAFTFLTLWWSLGGVLYDERLIAVREEPVWYPEFSQRNVTDGMLSSWKLPGGVVSQICSGSWSKLRRSLSTPCSLLFGGVSTNLPLRTSTTMRCGSACSTRFWWRGAHAPHCSTVVCDGNIERKRSSMEVFSTLRQEEKVAE